MTLLDRVPSLKSDPAPGFLERREHARTAVAELRAKLAELQLGHDRLLVQEAMGDLTAKAAASKVRSELVAVEASLQVQERLLEGFDRAEKLAMRASAEYQWDQVEQQRIADRAAWFERVESAIPTIAALADRMDEIAVLEERDRHSRQTQERLARDYDLDRSTEQVIAGAVVGGGIFYRDGLIRNFQEAIVQAERNGLRPAGRRGR